MPEGKEVKEGDRRRFSRGLVSGVLLVAGSFTLVFVSVRFSSDGSRLIVETLRALAVAAILVGAFMIVLALVLRGQNRTLERLQARDSVVATGLGGKSTTLRRELVESSGTLSTWRLPLYFCIAVERDRLSLWSESAGQLRCLGEVLWSSVDEVLLAPVRDGGRDFWGCRLVLRAQGDDSASRLSSVSLLLRGGGPGGIFGLSERVAREFVEIADLTRRQAGASSA